MNDGAVNEADGWGFVNGVVFGDPANYRITSHIKSNFSEIQQGKSRLELLV